MTKFTTISPIRFTFALAFGFAFLVLCSAFAVQGDLALTGSISAAFLLVGLALNRIGRRGGEVGAATALMGQAIALTAAFEGHPWQIDTHMLFFALLACLVVLRSIPAILMATAITAVHHLSLSVFMPALVYPGADLAGNLARTTIHAVIVLMETAVLVATVLILNRLQDETERRNAELEQTVKRSDDARDEADVARKRAESARQDAKAAQDKAESLLEEAREAEKLRADAEEEREAARAAYEAKSKQSLEEQAQVVSVIRDVMQRMQNGDLTTRIAGTLPEAYRDVGLAFDEALQAMDVAVSQVALQSDEIQSQVQEITSATSDLAERTERQAQMLRESSEGLAELTRVVAQTEETVREADASAQTAQSSAQSSEAIVNETSQAMHAIQSEAAEISKIVKVIDDIAFQTNLLALNAGVEAARAGEAGRGFAVVASEVRDLAQRSSASASSIRELITRSGEQVETGSAKIEETVTSLSAVLEAMFAISAKTGQITEGAREQTAGISELNQKVAHLDSATQQNAAMFEESSAACTKLLSAARALKALTQRFDVSPATSVQSHAA